MFSNIKDLSDKRGHMVGVPSYKKMVYVDRYMSSTKKYVGEFSYVRFPFRPYFTTQEGDVYWKCVIRCMKDIENDSLRSFLEVTGGPSDDEEYERL